MLRSLSTAMPVQNSRKLWMNIPEITNCLWKRLQFIVKTRRSMSLKEKNWVDICILIMGTSSAKQGKMLNRSKGNMTATLADSRR